MRLIDADEIKYEEHKRLGFGIDYSPGEPDVLYATYKHKIDSMPTIDAVEVVRCRNCKHWIYIKRTNRYWCKTDDGLYDLNPSPVDFCSRAERRTDEDG